MWPILKRRKIERVRALRAQASSAAERGELEAALRSAREAYALAEAELASVPAERIASGKLLAWVELQVGEREQGVARYEAAHQLAAATLGPEAAEVIEIAQGLAAGYALLGRSDEAAATLREAVASLRRAPDDRTETIYDSLKMLARIEYRARRFMAGDACLEDAVRTLAAARGPLAGVTVSMEGSGVRARLAAGDLEGAMILFQIQRVAAKVFPVMGRALYAQFTRRLGEVRERLDPGAAEPLLREALEVARSAIEPASPDLIAPLESLGRWLIERGNFADARPLLEQALAIYRSEGGEPDKEAGDRLSLVGRLEYATGRNEEARRHYEEALAVYARTEGKASFDFATASTNLAQVLHVAGEYGGAIALAREAVAIQRTLLHGRQATTAELVAHQMSLNNLAVLYHTIGDREQAMRLLSESLGAIKPILGERHPMVATVLQNVATLYGELGIYREALRLHEMALSIRRETLGEWHPDVAQSLVNLGLVEFSMGMDFCFEADGHLGQALEILRRVHGLEHPMIAHVMGVRGRVWLELGRGAKAVELLGETLAMQKRLLSEAHPDYGLTLGKLVEAFAFVDSPDRALRCAREAVEIEDQQLGGLLAITSERQRSAYLARLGLGYDQYLSIVLAIGRSNGESVRWGMDVVLRRKLLGLEAVVAQRDALLRGGYPELRPMLDEWERLSADLAARMLTREAPADPADERAARRAIEEQKEALEVELARRVPEIQLERELRDANVDTIAAALPADSALIEFVAFDRDDFKSPSTPAYYRFSKDVPDFYCKIEPWYVAFVLPAGRPDELAMVDLGKAGPIARLVADLHESIAEVSEVEAWNGEPGLELFRAVFAPVRERLGGRTRLFIAPDGELTRVPFEVLPTPEGRRVIDEYEISYLSVGRDMLATAADGAVESGEALVAADPDFDLGAAPHKAGVAPVRGAFLEEDFFEPLPGCRAEGEVIAALLGVRPLLGPAAIETAVKAYRSPRVLHLATHAYFLPQPNFDLTDEAGWARLAKDDSVEDPMLRSGLALAGANVWLAGGEPGPDAEDGLLSAHDLAAMDLRGTQLLVLSACETGLGGADRFEGVLGLRRAASLAGARSLVMSLWRVPDEETRDLMTDFYRRLLAGAPRGAALRAAQLALRQKHPQPYYWGGFICQGEAGPLTSTPIPVALPATA